MGLKSGSRDADLDDEEEESVDQEPAEAESATEASSSEPTDATAVETESTSEPEPTAERPSMASIPYKLRREKVNEGREQVPYFLREEIIEAEDELQDTLEELLGEDVYKSDYREAAMVVAQRNPELVAEVLREWGYDLNAT